MKTKIFITGILWLLLCSLGAYADNGVIRIVILGSSTAAGAGPENSANAWVNQYSQYVKSLNASSEVINLAVGGYTTYHILPSDYVAPAGKPSPDSEHNITKALSYSPDAIIINLPTNDAANYFTVEEQLNNYNTVLAKAKVANVPVWITTTQPRNFSAEQRQNLMVMRDSTYQRFGDKAIDFWTDIATEQGTINTAYDMGDGVHLNDAAHTILKNRVIATDILDYARSINSRDTINIDFGSTPSSGGWNNMTNATGDTIINMINNSNQRTGISVWIHDAFTGVNTSGTTTPDEQLPFPSSATSDNFFGSEVAHGGITEPTGGITLSGLDRNTLYSFSIFSSRNNVTDNRETEYTVIGKTEETAYLDPANNSGNVAEINDVYPAANGTIIITAAPGPNNTNSSKYYFMGAVQIVAVKQDVVYDSDGVINIDLGSKISIGNWNNLTMATGGETLNDLVNTEGNSTGISAWVHDAFTGVNETGVSSPDTVLGLTSDASSDSFFGSTGAHSGVVEATGGITLGGLKTDEKYSLSFFASRDGVSDNREAQYTVSGSNTETVYLDAANNSSNLVTVENITPAGNGTITILASPGPNNNNSSGYYYLGVIRIKYGSDIVSSEHIKSKNESFSLLTYPNPFQEQITFDCNFPEMGDVRIEIFSLDGKLTKVLSKKNVLAGRYSVTWDGKSNTGNRVDSGLYVCRVSFSTSKETFVNTQKISLK